MKREKVKEKSEITPVIYSRDEHNISRHNIDEDALKIMYRLIRNGYKAFLVGGGVRDLLLSKKPKDFDISTDATPRRIKSLFRNSRIIGRRFKLVHIFFRGNKNIEVSTFRDQTENVEEEEGSLKTDNVYGNETTDAMRRDLTINGLFYDLSTFSVIDYVGGMEDLKSGVIRVIGDPETRFRDDPVRLLRVIRHAARNNFKVNQACWDALIKNRELIVKSSAVRVYEEFKKDIVCGHFYEILKLLAKSGLLDYLLPVVSDKQKSYLNKGHFFSDIICSIDSIALSKETVTPTAALSAIALALMNSDETLVISQNDSEDKIKDQVKNIFSLLSVPRKEKERIVSIIHVLYELSTRDLKKVRLQSLSRRPYFKDLHKVAEIVGPKYIPEELKSVLEQAEKHIGKERTERERSDRDRPVSNHRRQNRHLNRIRRPG